MPMLCPTCEYHEETTESVCPKCGSPMRYSLLAGLDLPTDNSGVIRISNHQADSLSQRLGQVLLGIVWTNALAVGIAFLALLGLAFSSLQPETLAVDHPALFHTLAMGTALLAAIGMVLLQFRGVYLAQVAGGIAGFLGVAVMQSARLYLGIPLAWYEWFLVPVAGVASFAVGLSVAGRMEAEETFEFKPINSWDKNARPTEWVIAPPVSRPWNRLIAGVLVGLILWNGLGGILAMLLGPLLKNPTVLAVAMARVEWPLRFLACFAGGMTAASGTRSGFLQGFLAGIFLLGLQQAITPATSMEELVVLIFLVFLGSVLGGIFGRKIFRPYLLYGNARGVASAPPPKAEPVAAT